MLAEIRNLVQQVNLITSYDDALNLIVDRVLELLNADICSIYIKDKDDLVLMATNGLNPDCVGNVRLHPGEGLSGYVLERGELINLPDAEKHPAYKYIAQADENDCKAYLGAPIIHQRNSLGVIAVQQKKTRKFDENAEALVITLAAQLSGILAKVEKKKLLVNKNQTLIKGIKAAPGVAIGKLVTGFTRENIEQVPVKQTDDIEKEIKRFNKALLQAKKELKELSQVLEKELPKEERLLFETYSNMLSKEGLGDEVIRVIRDDSLIAASALSKVVSHYSHSMESINDPYLRERASDIRDMGRRVLKFLQQREFSRKRFPIKTVIYAHEVTASMLAEVEAGKLVGLISGAGSQFSHAAILAKALGIPAVMGIGDHQLDHMDMFEVIVDGFHGLVYINPSRQIKREFKRLHQEEQSLVKALQSRGERPLTTKDGLPIHLSLNIGLMSELKKYRNIPSDGVGLFRTEISFMQYERFPSEEEQYKLYRKALELLPDKPVVMRTLDAGGDKSLGYFQVKESNPFMGWRGVRMTLDHPELFLIQVRAMIRAHAELGNLSILLPMITSIDEVNECLTLIEQAHMEICHELGKTSDDIQMPKIGVVIEVPSVVFLIDQMPKEISFYSIGTNDLTQYMLAVDRNNHRVADLYDYFHPALFKVLEIALQSAKLRNRNIYICGEMVSDPLMTTLLLGMGFDGFSLNAVSLPRIHQMIEQLDQEWARQLFLRVKTCQSAEQVRDLVEDALKEKGLKDSVNYIR